MWNRWDAEIVLLDTNSEIVDGFDIPKETGRNEVLAERKGANRSEFYAAEAINRKIDEIFEVNALDYNGEIYILFEGHLYDVIRSYPVSVDKVSLSCERRAPR